MRKYGKQSSYYVICNTDVDEILILKYISKQSLPQKHQVSSVTYTTSNYRKTVHMGQKLRNFPLGRYELFKL